MQRDSIDLGTENVGKLFREMFFPTLLGMLSVSAVTAADGIFVGHGVGSDGIAAINICIPLLMIFTGVGLMSGIGASVVASIHLARGKAKAARLNVTQSLLFVTLLATLSAAAIMAAPGAVGLMLGSSQHLLPLVTDYMMWFVPALPIQMWITVGLFVIRLDGAPRLAMWCSVAAAAINVVLDYLFIFPLGWGVAGAAAASTLGELAGGAIVIVYLSRYARTLRLHPLKRSMKSLRLTLRNIAYHCRIGFPAMLGEATLAILMLCGNLTFMHYLGDDGVGAFGIACYYLPFAFMVGNAIAQSAQPIVSYNFGAGNTDRVRSAGRIALATAVVCGAITTAAFCLFPQQLVGLFLPAGNASARIATEGFPYFAAGFVPFVVNLTAIGYYQSLERARRATAFALLRGLVLLVPSFVLMPLAAGTAGIWLAMPVSEWLTAAAIAWTLRRR